MFIAIIVLLGILLIAVIAGLMQKAANTENYLEGYAGEADNKTMFQQRISMHYQYGHPAIGAPANVYVWPNKGRIEIYAAPLFTKGAATLSAIANIPIPAISEVRVNDYSTTAYKTTAGRILRFGDLGLALKTKEKAEKAELIINWKDGRNTHTTCFTKKGPGAVVDATAIKEKVESER